MHIPEFEEIIEQNDQTVARREHLDALRALVGNVYPNKFVRSSVSGLEETITNILKHPPIVEIVDKIKAVVATLAERERPPVEIKDALNARLRELGNVRVSGRLAVPPRVMGKAAFVHLSDGISRLQVYVRRDDVKGVWNGSTSSPPYEGGVAAASADGVVLSEPLSTPPATADGWEIFQLLDHGDFIGVEGYLFITNTGELSVHVETLQFLAKAMLPMPDKMHGIADAEIKQRQRYVDLIGSSLRVKTDEEVEEEKRTGIKHLTTREVFQMRAKIISSTRQFLELNDYIEVETPMLTPKATGAAAKPFKTHHNALDIDLYARIAPELYLKRLVVGGFEKVYELNRNFRNEGISYKHNPEFTMLEFYCAYMDVEGMMNFCEKLMRQSVRKATGGLTVKYEGKEIDFGRFERLTMKDVIYRFFSESWLSELDSAFKGEWLEDARIVNSVNRYIYGGWYQSVSGTEGVKLALKSNPLDALGTEAREIGWRHANESDASLDSSINDEARHGSGIARIFELYEENLVNPTFIIDFPKSISPLSKASPENPQIAERFELFINGMEVANGFSELNDPKEQYDRFIDQMGERDRGDEEAMILDEDYIRALSYGMPPAAGIGIGIDRLVMLLTNRHSIRDVILFPHMRPEKGHSTTEGTETTEKE